MATIVNNTVSHIWKFLRKWIFLFYLCFNWRIIALQNCVGFCQTSTWISHRSITFLIKKKKEKNLRARRAKSSWRAPPLLNLRIYYHLPPPTPLFLLFCLEKVEEGGDTVMIPDLHSSHMGPLFLPVFPRKGTVAFTVAYKVNHSLILWHSSSTLRCLPKISENMCPQKDLHVNV